MNGKISLGKLSGKSYWARPYFVKHCQNLFYFCIQKGPQKFLLSWFTGNENFWERLAELKFDLNVKLSKSCRYFRHWKTEISFYAVYFEKHQDATVPVYKKHIFSLPVNKPLGSLIIPKPRPECGMTLNTSKHSYLIAQLKLSLVIWQNISLKIIYCA